ncbi:MAG: NAD(P)/FAD-dependent oxidoreductase [Bacilli bacterium]|nr:NAD(P)/FAD-dependent oxidoreductase [Bacilli bacterium]
MKRTDIVIIGSGMAGISAALYLKRANADFIILEGNLAGGMLNQLKTVENFPAAGKTNGSDILISLMDQLRYNNIPLVYGNAQTILKEDGGFEVVTDVDSYEAKAVIVATGLSQASKTIPGEEKFAGLGVSYCATCDGNFFKGADVAVVGNNNICLEESLYLAGLVKKLYLVCPDENLNGDKRMIDKINSSENIEIILQSNVDEIVGDDFGVTGIKINGKIINISGVFPYIGKKTSTQILNNLKPEMKGIFVKANEERMTNIPGLYVAGDIVDKKLKQLITAAGDGAAAATSADNYCKLLK